MQVQNCTRHNTPRQGEECPRCIIDILRDENSELLAALEAIVRQWDTPNWKLAEHTGVFIAQARAAIAKAKGV